MSRHLPLLTAMFPGKLMLNVDDIASLTAYSKGHIYNLASTKKLPFKIAEGLGDRILVSVIEMADYLDSKLLSKSAEKSDPEPEPTSTKRKVGRPRGTTKASLAIRCFQAELRTAIYQHQFAEILTKLRKGSEAVLLPVNDAISCQERMDSLKHSMMDQVARAEAGFEAVVFEFLLPRP